MFSFLRKSYAQIDYVDLISKLQENQDKVSTLLFESERIEYLPVTYAMLQKMVKPIGATEALKLHSKYEAGKFELAIFEVPWNNSDVKFLPLILDKKVCKIVGVMLPFNELLQELTQGDQKQIHKLSILWTSFIMQASFGV